MDCRRFMLRSCAMFTAALLCAGCMSMPRSAYDPSAQFPTTTPTVPTMAPSSAPTPAPMDSAAGTARGAAPASAADVLVEVQQLGRLNPEAQQVLLEQLKRSDPSLWPQVVQVFRSSMAYAEQAAERDRLLAQSRGADSSVPAEPANVMQPASWPRPQYAPVEPVADQPHARLLPPAENGPILMARYATELAARYPSTELPEIQLASSAATGGSSPTARAEAGAPEESSPSNVPNGDWRTQLDGAIRALESQTAAEANAETGAADQAALRFLYLTAGRREDALRPMTGVGGAQQDFWTAELFALASLLEQDGASDDTRRQTEAAQRLHEAAMKLGRSADLVVRNLAFCTEVTSFGMYKPFDRYVFKSGQEALLYAEVENFTSEPTEKGFHTALRSRYEIVDSRGAAVAQQDFAVTEEYCRNPRRDFFIRYFLRVPSNLEPGDYTLKLTIADAKSGKIGEATIAFQVPHDHERVSPRSHAPRGNALPRRSASKS